MLYVINYLEGGVGGTPKVWANYYPSADEKAEKVFSDFNKDITGRKVVIGIDIR